MTILELRNSPPPGARTVPTPSAPRTEQPERLPQDAVSLSEVEPVGFKWTALALATLSLFGAGTSMAAAAAAPPAAPAISFSMEALAGALKAQQPSNRLQAEHPTLWDSPLKLGSEGDRVTRFQKYLNHYQKVEATGKYDEATEKAVKAFQKANGLSDDGVAGEMTFGKLWSKLFWEKNIVADLQGSEMASKMPAKVRIVVDVKTQRLYIVDAANGKAVRAYPVSTGSSEFPTPKKDYKITKKTVKPSWYPPASTWAKGSKVTPPGPNNPLGPAHLQLSWSTILIHGVPPASFSTLGRVGASHGCIRMFPQHVWELQGLMKLDTPVKVTSGAGLTVQP